MTSISTTPITLPTSLPIPLLLGSSHVEGNNRGLAAFLKHRFSLKVANQLKLAAEFFDSEKPFPSGPITTQLIPQGVDSLEKYKDTGVRALGSLVLRSPALVILTPQYNRGYPGALKNVIDQIYHEWNGLPILLVTYGGHGGGRAAAQLKQVLEEGVEARVVECVEISLPGSLIRGASRFEFSEGEKSFLDEEERDRTGAIKMSSPQKRVDEAIDKLLDAVKAREEELKGQKEKFLEGIKSTSDNRSKGGLEMKLSWENERSSERARVMMEE